MQPDFPGHKASTFSMDNDEQRKDAPEHSTASKSATRAEQLTSAPTEQDRLPDISLSVPCYNEEEALRETMLRLLEAFESKGFFLELVLVDNGSQDRTGEVIDQLIADGHAVVKGVVEVNQGQGLGYLTGLKLCRAPWVGIIPADGQVQADDVAKLYESARNMSEPTLLKVRRRFRLDGFKRKVVSIVYNGFANVLFLGLGSIDINGSPKLVRRDDMERMNLRSIDWFLEPEMLIRAKQLGLSVFEVNVMGQMREGGSSNVRSTTCWEFLVNLFRARFGHMGSSS